jgi:hypothetical protein
MMMILKVIAKLASAEFGEMAADHSRNQWLRKIDQTSYTKVVDPKGTIVGFYDVFRLSKMGTAAALRGEFHIKDCPHEYLRGDNKHRYIAIYVGGVYVNSKAAKAMVLGAISRHLNEVRQTIIFAKAGSADGLRLLKNAKFVPVKNTESEIGHLFMRRTIQKVT